MSPLSEIEETKRESRRSLVYLLLSSHVKAQKPKSQDCSPKLSSLSIQVNEALVYIECMSKEKI